MKLRYLFLAGTIFLVFPVWNFVFPSENLLGGFERLNFVMPATAIGLSITVFAVVLFIQRHYGAYTENKLGEKEGAPTGVKMEESQDWGEQPM